MIMLINPYVLSKFAQLTITFFYFNFLFHRKNNITKQKVVAIINFVTYCKCGLHEQISNLNDLGYKI